MKRVPTRDLLGFFVVTRILLMLVTYFGFIFLTQQQYSSAPVDIGVLVNTWRRWDATAYVRIAEVGYQPPFDYAFFPLFPLLIRVVAAPFNLDYLLVGMFISNLALLATLFSLYYLVVDWGGEKVARNTIVYLCLFPTAFFFFAAYNESLFVFLTVTAFLAMRKQKWWIVGLLGLLASLTRSTGIFLVLPYLYELWQQRESMWGRPGQIVYRAFSLLLIPLGTLLYSLYCLSVTGDAVAFASVQSRWSRHLTWPWEGLWQAFFELFWNQPFGSFNQVHIVLDLTATLGFIALTVIGWKKLRVSYSIWMILLLLSPLSSASVGQHDSLISNQRFVLEMFPGFMTLAMLGLQHPRFHRALLWMFPALLAMLSLLFVVGQWMV